MWHDTHVEANWNANILCHYILVQSPSAREEFKLQDSASALARERSLVWEQHSPQNPLQQRDATGGWVTLEKTPKKRSAETMGR